MKEGLRSANKLGRNLVKDEGSLKGKKIEGLFSSEAESIKNRDASSILEIDKKVKFDAEMKGLEVECGEGAAMVKQNIVVAQYERKQRPKEGLKAVNKLCRIAVNNEVLLKSKVELIEMESQEKGVCKTGDVCEVDREVSEAENPVKNDRLIGVLETECAEDAELKNGEVFRTAVRDEVSLKRELELEKNMTEGLTLEELEPENEVDEDIVNVSLECEKEVKVDVATNGQEAKFGEDVEVEKGDTEGAQSGKKRLFEESSKCVGVVKKKTKVKVNEEDPSEFSSEAISRVLRSRTKVPSESKKGAVGENKEVLIGKKKVEVDSGEKRKFAKKKDESSKLVGKKRGRPRKDRGRSELRKDEAGGMSKKAFEIKTMFPKKDGMPTKDGRSKNGEAGGVSKKAFGIKKLFFKKDGTCKKDGRGRPIKYAVDPGTEVAIPQLKPPSVSPEKQKRSGGLFAAGVVTSPRLKSGVNDRLRLRKKQKTGEHEKGKAKNGEHEKEEAKDGEHEKEEAGGMPKKAFKIKPKSFKDGRRKDGRLRKDVMDTGTEVAMKQLKLPSVSSKTHLKSGGLFSGVTSSGLKSEVVNDRLRLKVKQEKGEHEKDEAKNGPHEKSEAATLDTEKLIERKRLKDDGSKLADEAGGMSKKALKMKKKLFKKDCKRRGRPRKVVVDTGTEGASRQLKLPRVSHKKQKKSGGLSTASSELKSKVVNDRVRPKKEQKEGEHEKEKTKNGQHEIRETITLDLEKWIEIKRLKDDGSYNLADESQPQQKKKVSQNKKQEKAGLREEKQAIRDKIMDILLRAGWTVEYRPRQGREEGREYNDAVFVNTDGKTHWSTTKAYRDFKKKFDENPDPTFSFTPIPEEELEKLKRVTKKKDPNNIGGPPREKKKKKRMNEDNSSGKSRKRVKQSTKKPNRQRCALLVRRSKTGVNSEIDGFVPYTGKRSLLTWMIELGTIVVNGVVQYMNHNREEMLEGRIRRDGIQCGCCNEIVTISDFEIHSGSKLKQPFDNTYASGKSLSNCMLDSWNMQKESDRKGFHFINIDGEDPNDDTCAICGDGGDLICCDACPSTFHQSCLDIQKFPSGDWHCVYCSCKFCKNAGSVMPPEEGSCDATASALLTCQLCEEKYHQLCIQPKDSIDKAFRSPSFCGKKCQELFGRIEMVLGVKHELKEGYSWTLLHRSDVSSGVTLHGEQKKLECNSKLAVGLSIMQECFLPIVDQRSGINLIHNIVYNCGSNFNRLNFGGFFTFILERGDELISVASVRIHGNHLAEMPFIGTRHMYRRQGMCRRLLTAIESALGSLNVEKLVIPAIAELRKTWTSVFDFKPLEDSTKQKIKCMNMLVFHGTDMLEKPLLTHCSSDNVTPATTKSNELGEEKQDTHKEAKDTGFTVSDETIADASDLTSDTVNFQEPDTDLKSLPSAVTHDKLESENIITKSSEESIEYRNDVNGPTSLPSDETTKSNSREVEGKSFPVSLIGCDSTEDEKKVPVSMNYREPDTSEVKNEVSIDVNEPQDEVTKCRLRVSKENITNPEGSTKMPIEANGVVNNNSVSSLVECHSDSRSLPPTEYAVDEENKVSMGDSRGPTEVQTTSIKLKLEESTKLRACDDESEFGATTTQVEVRDQKVREISGDEPHGLKEQISSAEFDLNRQPQMILEASEISESGFKVDHSHSTHLNPELMANSISSSGARLFAAAGCNARGISEAGSCRLLESDKLP